MADFHFRAEEPPLQQPAYAPLQFINPESLEGRIIRPRRWVVQDWLPIGSVTLHYAPPGEGKTLLALQLMVAGALGLPWVGLPVQPFRSVGMFCEDDCDEVHRRLDDILRLHGYRFCDLGDMMWSSPTGDDNTLVRFAADGEMEVTDRWLDLFEQAKAHQAKLVVVDTAADLYGGSENDRAQVTAFVKQGLGRLARDLDCAVLCNAHPSKNSVSKGAPDFDSGSTAWTGSARSRWALVTPRDEERKIIDPKSRILAVTKANYAATGTEIQLRWDDGTFQSVDRPTGLAGLNDALCCEAKMLDIVGRAIAANVNLSGSVNAGNYAPKRMKDWPDGGLYTVGEFQKALNRLLEQGRLINEDYGPASHRKTRLVISQPHAEK